MLPTFLTTRLVVRPLAAQDFEPLFALIYAEPEVRRHFTNLSEREAAAAAHQGYVAANADPAKRGYGHWTVAERVSGTVLGKLLLEAPAPVPWIEPDPGSALLPLGDETELGYAFGMRYWGQGYAVEACRALIPYAFEVLGLARIVNSVRRANAASLRLMTKLGFEVEEQARHPDFVLGVLTPTRYAQALRGRKER